VLRILVPLFGGLAVPAGSLGMVLWHSLSLGIHVTDGVLSFRIALIGSFAIPEKSFGIILRYSLTLVIHIAEIVFSFGITLVGRFAVPASRFVIVLTHSLAVLIHAGELKLGFGVSLLSAYAARAGIGSEFPLDGSTFDEVPGNCSAANENHATNKCCDFPRRFQASTSKHEISGVAILMPNLFLW
jgi:hypothetical protein